MLWISIRGLTLAERPNFTTPAVLAEAADALEKLLPATLEFYRELEAAANLAIAKRRDLDAALALENAGKSRSVKIEYDGGIKSKAVRMTLGEFDPDDIKHLTAIIDIINKTRRERERIYNQFERKRRPALLNAVKYSEVNDGAARILDNLSD